MAVELYLTTRAEFDLMEAYSWYETHRGKLGEQFLESFDASLISILRNPNAYARVHPRFRRCVMKRFPYSIYYHSDGDTITICGVFHHARNPKKWRSRLG